MEHKDSPVDLVDALLTKAITDSASDIHIEPLSDSLQVRMRYDGILRCVKSIPQELSDQLIARLKVLANMNTTQKRIPQDGKFVFNHNDGQSIDVRLSSFPSVFGEKMVIRILDPRIHMIDLANLGFAVPVYDAFCKLVQMPSGFLLVTGPTGSGKTTTLYASLQSLNKRERNIVTLEDPVEYSLPGITQAQINSEIGFTFLQGMRSLVRQDPDVIMIGEIRDKETARTAIEAAMTGHLVLSTMHTNDAPSAVVRLMDMGIEPYLINASLTGVLTQRLVRKICERCAIKSPLTEQQQQMLAHKDIHLPNDIVQPQGCDNCHNTGYTGRTGIFELLVVTPTIRTVIMKQPSLDALRSLALHEGMIPLTNDAIDKVKQGITSLHECARVVW